VQGLSLFEQAIKRDSDYGPALAYAAHCRLQLAEGGWATDRELNRRDAVDLARRAIAATPDDPNVLPTAAGVLAYFEAAQLDTLIALVKRALSLNPSSARAWNWSGWLMLWDGRADVAIHDFETSMRLAPRDRMGMSLCGIGMSHFLTRRFDDAVPKLLASLEELRAFALTYRVLSACYAHLGRLDEAREIVNRLRAITFNVMPDLMFLRRPEDRELLLSGLRLAADGGHDSETPPPAIFAADK
jgi:adenylate cyclase